MTIDSRDALFAHLTELSRGGASADRLAAARDAIRRGHLGSPAEAIVGGAPLLVWAVRWNDVELIELLLAQGVSPLAVDGSGESALRLAHAQDRDTFEVVRRAARQAGEAAPLAGLATAPWERRFTLRTDRGVADLRRSVDATQRLDVLCVRSDLKNVARALGNLVNAPRRMGDVAARPVPDAQRLLFLYRLRGIDWTIVPFVFDAASPWNVAHVLELNAPGTGIAPIARALAGASASRVVHVRYDGHTIYTEHGGIETRAADASDELIELGVFVPPMRARTDGYHVQLELLGLDAAEIERVDVVVLQELGDPAVDRRTAVPAAGPAIVGAPVLLMPNLPALVEQPPEALVDGPARSEAPPLVREAPPMVVLDEGPALSEAAPLKREAPPMLEVPELEVPELEVPEREAPAEEPPAVPEPPLSSGPSTSGPPPMVHAPPPMVAPATDEGSDPDA